MSNKRYPSKDNQKDGSVKNNKEVDINTEESKSADNGKSSLDESLTVTESSTEKDGGKAAEAENSENYFDISSDGEVSSNTDEQLVLTEENIETIFNDDVLDIDDTVFSDETVVLIQYIPENETVIETDFNANTCSEILETEFSNTFKLKSDENGTTDAENVEKAEEDEAEIEAKLNKRRKRKIIRRTVKIVLSVFCVVFIIAGILMLYYYDLLNAMIYKELDNPATSSQNGFSFSVPTDLSSSSVSSGSASSEAVSDWTVDLSDGTTLLNDPMVLNVMLFGSDTRYADSTGNSDTMILLSLDNRHHKIKFTSFMRDTWINIPGYGANKMNAAYSFGGPSLAIETIQRNYGIKIDRYAIVDFASFTEIINCLGGIDIELTEFEIDYINWQMYENHQVNDRHYIKAKPGIVHLDGREALWHARNRDSALSDFDRTSRQRQVVSTILNEFKDSSITTILDAVSKVGPMITTNLRKSEITTLVKNSLTYLSYDQEEYSLPDISSDNIVMANGFPTQYGNLDVLLIPDWQRARRDLAGFIFEDSLVGYTKPDSSSAS